MSAATIDPTRVDPHDNDADSAIVASIRGVTMRFGSVVALDDVSLDLHANKIYGLLGRNGAGKTTLMQTMTGQMFPSSGDIKVFGHTPHENTEVLRGVSFIKESQAYPTDYKVHHVLAAARHLLRDWDEEFARELLSDFALPTDRKVKKLSRGMTSALGVTIGLASRAPLTFFDEPYLGLDASARQLFYDRLLSDYAEHPRTVVLSTHLIDEVSELLEHVIVIDGGRVVADADADELRASAVTVSGNAEDVDTFLNGRTTLRRESIGAHTRVMVRTADRVGDVAQAQTRGLMVEPVSLQQLIVETTTMHGKDAQ